VGDADLRVTYLVDAAPGDIEARADTLLLEQTVELSRAALGEQPGRTGIVGRIEALIQESESRWRVIITQPLAAAARDPAQLLNVVWGNSSLQVDVLLADLDLPDAAFDWLPGPRTGIPGLRGLVGVPERPLVATVLKPMGLGPGDLAERCLGFARAGIDLVKDDHGLADHSFAPFEARVEACLRATEAAERDTGRRAVYLPNLIGTPDRVVRQLEFARAAGVRAVMLSPVLVGLPLLHQLASAAGGLPILAHPSLGGVLRTREPVLFGKLFRWYGADGVIFPHAGGRFGYGQETCRELARVLRTPHPRVRSSFPVPAGGVRLERVEELFDFYGLDVILLIGGSLYEAGSQLFERARALTDRVARAFARRGHEHAHQNDR
jgi:ribulose-bisphosphate carboxylase large chain